MSEAKSTAVGNHGCRVAAHEKASDPHNRVSEASFSKVESPRLGSGIKAKLVFDAQEAAVQSPRLGSGIKAKLVYQIDSPADSLHASEVESRQSWPSLPMYWIQSLHASEVESRQSMPEADGGRIRVSTPRKWNQGKAYRSRPSIG